MREQVAEWLELQSGSWPLALWRESSRGQRALWCFDPDGLQGLRGGWDADSDAEVLSSPVRRLAEPRPFLPRLTRRHVALGAGDAAKLRASAERLARMLAAAHPSDLVLDGVTYRLRTRGLYLKQNCGDWSAPIAECKLWDACFGRQSSSG